MASLAVGAPVESTGIPRELKTMQAVFAMAVPELFRQAGACPIVLCVPDGGLPRLPKPKVTPCDRVSVPPSAPQAPVPALFQTSIRNVWAERSAYTRALVKSDAPRIFANTISPLRSRASPPVRKLSLIVRYFGIAALAMITPT